MKKEGPNFNDENRIKECVEAGMTAGEISDRLQVKERAVAIFMETLGVEVEVPEPAVSDTDVVGVVDLNTGDIELETED